MLNGHPFPRGGDLPMTTTMMTDLRPPLRAKAPRARRFNVPGKIRYRRSEELDWREGRIENVSGRGVLFMADRPEDMGSRIQMRLMLAPKESGEFRLEVAASGRILRQRGHQQGTNECATAASIATYRILPRRHGRG